MNEADPDNVCPREQTSYWMAFRHASSRHASSRHFAGKRYHGVTGTGEHMKLSWEGAGAMCCCGSMLLKTLICCGRNTLCFQLALLLPLFFWPMPIASRVEYRFQSGRLYWELGNGAGSAHQCSTTYSGLSFHSHAVEYRHDFDEPRHMGYTQHHGMS